MNKWSQSSRALPEQAEQLYGINVWFISAGEKHVLHCGNIKAQSERAWRSSVSLRVAYKHLFSKGHLWRAHCTDVLPAICHVLAYSSSMKRSCENKQQLTRCHIWQWSRSPRGVSANPFLSQREKGEFLQTSGIKTNPGNAEDASQIQRQYYYSRAVFYILCRRLLFCWTGAKHIFVDVPM